MILFVYIRNTRCELDPVNDLNKKILPFFPHFGPHIWNNLTQDISRSSTLSSFKSKLKTFLFSKYFS